MEANGQSGGASAWPTAMASFVVISLLISMLSLGFLVDRSNGTRVVAATSATATAAAVPDSTSVPERPTVSRPVTPTRRSRARSRRARCTR